MIQGYADSRALPYQQDPNTPVDADSNWMLALFNDGNSQDQEVIDNLELVGDLAPYPFEGDANNTDTMYPGGETQLPFLQFHDISFVSGTTIGGTTRMKGGNFPCGLIRFDTTNWNVTENILLQIDLVPGNHRGYLCESMMEF